jgi:hypothetical protein
MFRTVGDQPSLWESRLPWRHPGNAANRWVIGETPGSGMTTVRGLAPRMDKDGEVAETRQGQALS